MSLPSLFNVNSSTDTHMWIQELSQYDYKRLNQQKDRSEVNWHTSLAPSAGDRSMDTAETSNARGVSTLLDRFGRIGTQNPVVLSIRPVDAHWEKLGCSTVLHPFPQRIKRSCWLSSPAASTMGQTRRLKVPVEVLYVWNQLADCAIIMLCTLRWNAFIGLGQLARNLLR